MLSQDLSRQILSIGPPYQPPKGGIAQVLANYSECIFMKFNFISTTLEGSKLKKLVHLILALVQFTIRCLSPEIKIVHIHGASRSSFYRKRIFIYIAKALGKKVIYHMHGGQFDQFCLVHKKQVQRTLHKVDTLIALSGYWQNFFEEHFTIKQISVIPNITPYESPRERGTSDIVHGLFMSKLIKDKGIYDIIDMATRFRTALEGKIIIHIGGNGETEQVQKLIAEKQLDSILLFEGWICGEKKQQLLRSSDFYLLPSYIEGLPISILEAMSHSLPILSTPIGGIPEVVEEGVNGLLIPPGNLDAMFQAIQQLLASSLLRQQMGKASYQKVQIYFPDKVEEKLEALYNNLLSK